MQKTATLQLTEFWNQRGNNILGDMRIRPRKIPKLNFEATTLQELVKWENGVVQEPVFTLFTH